jgi:hypothetical protein
MAAGLKRIGLPHIITDSRQRIDGVPILLGTTFWRRIEATGPYLLIDRCSYGNTDHYVTLVWNGHGRRGDHKVPANFDASRWEKHQVPLMPWKTGSKRVLAGQTESYCHRSLEGFYGSVDATHFRKHPAGENPTGLPAWDSFDDIERLITLNSSVAVSGMIQGVRTEIHDEGGMAYGTECNDESRLRLMHWLAWTQWSHDEIAEGLPWKYLL